MNEENKNLNENTEVVEPATPVKAEPSGIDKKKIGIMAGAAIIFIAVLVALIIAMEVRAAVLRITAITVTTVYIFWMDSKSLKENTSAVLSKMNTISMKL